MESQRKGQDQGRIVDTQKNQDKDVRPLMKLNIKLPTNILRCVSPT